MVWDDTVQSVSVYLLSLPIKNSKSLCPAWTMWLGQGGWAGIEGRGICLCTWVKRHLMNHRK